MTRARRAGSGWPAAAAVFLSALHLSRCALAATTVDDCIALALARAPTVRSAAADIEAARAVVQLARAAYFPQLLAQAEYGIAGGFDEVVTDGGRTAAVLTVQALLFDGGVRGAQLAAARARVQSAAARDRQRRADVALAVRVAYFTGLAVRDEAAIHRSGADSLRGALDLLERQAAQGLIPLEDALRVKLAIAATLGDERAALANLDAAMHTLELLTGRGLAAHDLVEADQLALIEAGSAIEDSPVVADARALLDAANDEREAVRRERRGQWTLTARGGALGVRPRRDVSRQRRWRFPLRLQPAALRRRRDHRARAGCRRRRSRGGGTGRRQSADRRHRADPGA